MTGPTPPSATTVTQTISLPSPPTGSNTVQVTLPAAGGIKPALTLGAGYPAGTQFFMSSSNFGQTSSVARVPAGTTFASCPVLLDITAYATQSFPNSVLQALQVDFTSVSFANMVTLTLQIYDAGPAPAGGGSLPTPAATNGCPNAPAASTVLATATTPANGSVAIFNGLPTNLSSALTQQLQALYSASSTGYKFPANEVFGFYITGGRSASPTSTPTTAPTPTPSPTPSPSPTPTPSPTPSPTPTPSPAPTATPSAIASAALTGTQMTSATALALPTLNNGAYSGTITSSTYTGSGSDAYVATYGNYAFGGSSVGAPTPPPNVGNVYAEVSVLLTSAPNGTQGWNGSPSGNMTLTVPSTAGKSSVTLRMWEGNGAGGPPALPLCVNQTTGGVTQALTPGTGGQLAFASPFQLFLTSGAALTACTNDPSINPLTAVGSGVWILITDN